MTDAVIAACFADWKLIRTRAVVQLVFEIPIENADAAYQVVGGMPIAAKERWFAICPLREGTVRPENYGAKKDATPAAKETAPSPQPTPNPNVPAGAKRSKSWHEMLPAQQAGILCSEPAFLRYLETEYPPEYNSINMMDGGTDAGELVRLICGVSSRAELVPGSAAAETWKQIASGYRAWMEEPKVMG